MTRRPGRLIGALVVAVIAVLVLHAVVVRAADRRLEDAGLTWRSKEVGALSIRWLDVDADGMHLGEVEASVLPAGLVGRHVALDARRLRPSQPGVGGTPATIAVRVEDLAVSWGDVVLANGLAGSLSPTVDLSGPDAELGRVDGRWWLRLRRTVDEPHLSGPVALEVTEEPTGWRLAADSEGLVLRHPLLATQALPPAVLHLAGSWTPETGRLDVSGRLGEVPVRVEGDVAPGGDASVEIDIGGPLEDVLALFGPLVPEASRAQLGGTIGLTLSLSGAPLSWRAVPRAQDLHAEGILPDADALRAGRVTWRGRDVDGGPLVRQIEPTDLRWVDPRRAGTLAAAVIAAEDSDFWNHPGYDLRAVQAALDEAAADPTDLRGGSTLTQQLAKNLFTGDERTLARKLRELLYAVELERVVAKPTILALYLNIVELGPGIHGMGEAAERAFLKEPHRLSLKEAVFLAALLPAPRTLWPRAMAGHPPVGRMRTVLDNLVAGGTIDPQTAAAAVTAPLRLLPPLP